MRLTDNEIRLALIDGSIKISPMPDLNTISGVSVDVRLDKEFRTYQPHTTPFIDLKDLTAEQVSKVMSDPIIVGEDERFILHPGQLALGVTLENIQLPDDVVGWLDGRSSLARLGLQIHVTAHRIDPGWNGKVVLEFYNAGPVPLGLHPTMRIGALNFEKLSGPVDKPYSARSDAKYQIQDSVVSTRLQQGG